MASYRMREEYYRLQREGLHDLFCGCGRFGHRDATCPKKIARQRTKGDEETSKAGSGSQAELHTTKEARYGGWTMVQRCRRKTLHMAKGNSGSSGRGNDRNSKAAHLFGDLGGDQAVPKQSLSRKTAAKVLPDKKGLGCCQTRRVCMRCLRLRMSMIKGS